MDPHVAFGISGIALCGNRVVAAGARKGLRLPYHSGHRADTAASGCIINAFSDLSNSNQPIISRRL